MKRSDILMGVGAGLVSAVLFATVILANACRELATHCIPGITANVERCREYFEASFGLATYPQDGDTLHAIIRSADTMMYHAKARGRDQIAIADRDALASMPVPKTSRHA